MLIWSKRIVGITSLNVVAEDANAAAMDWVCNCHCHYHFQSNNRYITISNSTPSPHKLLSYPSNPIHPILLKKTIILPLQLYN